MRKIMVGVLAMAALGLAGWVLSPRATPEAAATDGYLVLAVSWTPSWCASEGDDRKAARCAPGAGAGWLVHGLWPQHDSGGWPEFCPTDHPTPTSANLRAMEDIMGASGLAAHQWRKHGSCTNLAPAQYFEQTRRAFAALDFPPSLRAEGRAQRIRPDDLMAEFRAANPGIGPDMAVLTCRAGQAQELRLCLRHDLTPRRCDDALLARACRAGQVELPALR
ncbi:MAG: ribonuclease T [Roseinatronobacter sp.]|nr:ribonuclease T [Roseinatronobacter sp.]